jgi:hypothetical protein
LCSRVISTYLEHSHKTNKTIKLLNLEYRNLDTEIIKEINNKTSTAKCVTIYDVGQGNCSAICDDNFIPLLYFDFSGIYGRNMSSAKVNQRFCVTFNKVVALFHWYKGHWIGANRFIPIKSSLWVVPYESIGS